MLTGGGGLLVTLKAITARVPSCRLERSSPHLKHNHHHHHHHRHHHHHHHRHHHQMFGWLNQCRSELHITWRNAAATATFIIIIFATILNIIPKVIVCENVFWMFSVGVPFWGEKELQKKLSDNDGRCNVKGYKGSLQKKNRFFLGKSPKQRTPPTHPYGLGLK